jgi:hypothetical protein
MAGWRYIARRLNGDGTETGIDNDVPLSGVELRDDLSGPGGIDAHITPEIARLIQGNEPVFKPWSAAIYAEKDGQIRAGALLYDMVEDGPDLRLDTVGWSGYASGIPYVDEIIKVQVDPMDMARHIWEHIQSQPGGNIGLTLDSTTSKVKIGDGPDAAAFGENMGPYRLAWFQNHDLASDFDQLAADTPFEYRIVHSWSGEDISHRMVLGQPRIGARRADLRFMVGENVHVVPTIEYDGDQYASEVIVLGAGEGREMVRGNAVKNTGRLRRPVIVTDKNLRTKKEANARAERELMMRMGDPDIVEISVLDNPNAPYGSYTVGDEIFIQTAKGWTDDLELWCRILSIRFRPDDNAATLTVVRSDKVA